MIMAIFLESLPCQNMQLGTEQRVFIVLSGIGMEYSSNITIRELMMKSLGNLLETPITIPLTHQ